MAEPGDYPTIADTVGDTPLVSLQRTGLTNGSVVLAKLEGNNPAGSVKDRPALSMINAAERDGILSPGASLIEATSGNTGIALAMAAAIKGYAMILVMPAGGSRERVATMRAYGAEVIESDQSAGMEGARDLAERIEAERGAIRLDQFANPANPAAHESTTGPELWEQTHGTLTHVVSSMGTTGTITGLSRFLRSVSPAIQIIGVQPTDGESIPGIRAWPPEYLPAIYDPSAVDHLHRVTRAQAEDTTRWLARTEGIFAGISTGGAARVALDVAANSPGATVAFIACDRGDRYLSTGMFDVTS